MIKNILLFLLAFGLTFGACSNSAPGNSIKITGKVKFPQNGFIILEEAGATNFEPQDTIRLNDDGSFKYTLNHSEPNIYRLNFYNSQMVMLVLDEEDIEVNVDGNSPNGAVKVSGSSDTQYFNEMNAILQQFQSKVNVINEKYVNAKNQGKMMEATALENDYIKLQKENSGQLKSLIRKMGTSITALFAVNVLNKDEEFPFLDSVATKFEKERPDLKMGQDFVAQIKELKALSPGQMAPEIMLPNPEGKMVSLSSLKGKVILIDFWASWCGPCRKENPNVVKIYNKYKDQGFDILGVSLDKSKEDWVAAINKDGLIWNHVSDLKYWQSPIAQTYKVSAIPATYLIGKDGKIIAKNLRGEELEAKLEELF